MKLKKSEARNRSLNTSKLSKKLTMGTSMQMSEKRQTIDPLRVLKIDNPMDYHMKSMRSPIPLDYSLKGNGSMSPKARDVKRNHFYRIGKGYNINVTPSNTDWNIKTRKQKLKQIYKQVSR